MQFKVRDDYVVHLETTKQVTRQGVTSAEVQTTVYYGGDEIEMTAEQAALHAARIEAVDKSAAKFLDGLTLSAVAAAPAAIDPAVLAAAVAAALAQMGVTAPAAPAA